MKTERQPQRQRSQTLLLKYQERTETLKENTVLTDIQHVECALKAINAKDEEDLMLMMKKKSETLKK